MRRRAGNLLTPPISSRLSSSSFWSARRQRPVRDWLLPLPLRRLLLLPLLLLLARAKGRLLVQPPPLCGRSSTI